MDSVFSRLFAFETTRQTEVRYTDLPSGDYVFEVQAVDRDLNYSESVDVRLAIHPPYRQWALFGVLYLALFGLVIASGYGLRRRRERDQAREQLVQELEEELQTAHEMQMGLMPKENPGIKGFDISGRCIPANHVGGDFFQYFSQDDKLAICMADVTGHAMEAAVPVMMFSGVLHTEMQYHPGLEQLFGNLNRNLHITLERRTFVCFAMGEIDLVGRVLRLVNVGCPPLYHFQVTTGQVVELEGGGYPLGVRPEANYAASETALEPGDAIVFCSDGIIEAANAQEDIFGFERTVATIQQGCTEGLSAEALIDRLIDTVQAFAEDEPQGDDMTCVVLKVEA